MRRLMAAAAATAALLVAGCSTDKTDTAATAPTPAAGSSAGAATGASAGASAGAKGAAGDAALSGNTKAICDQAAKTGGNAGATFAQDLKLLIDAESSKDKAAVAAAQQKTTRDVENYSYALQDMSKLTDDAALKKALATMSASVGKLKGDVRKIDAEELGRLQGTLDKACGNG